LETTDISTQVAQGTTPLPEAVDNIQSSKVLNIHPDSYKDGKDTLEPAVKQITDPPAATPVVADTINQSAQHAAACKSSIPMLCTAEKIFGDIGQKVSNRYGPEARLNELNWKKLTSESDKFSLDDEAELATLRERAKDNFGGTDYGLSRMQSVPGDVASMIADLPNVVGRHKKLIGGILAADTAVGAGAGALAGGVGAIPGAEAGFATGVGHAYIAASTADMFQQTAAATYNELDTVLDGKGQPVNIDDQTKKFISYGVGTLGAAVEGVVSAATAGAVKNNPYIQQLINPKWVSKNIAGNAMLKKAMTGIGKAVGAGALGMGYQEVLSLFTEEFGKDFDSKQSNLTNITNALLRIDDKLQNDPKYRQNYLERVGHQVLVGATTHLVTTGGLHAIGKIGSSARGEAPVTEPGQISAPPSDIVDPQSEQKQAVQVLEFHDNLDTANKILHESDLGKHSPEMVQELRSKMIQQHTGIENVYIDPEDLTKLSTDEQKARAIRDKLDPSGLASAKLNQPVRIKLDDALTLEKDIPSVTEYLKLHPEGPSPDSAKAWYERKKAADAERVKLQEKLKVGERSPEERAYDTNVTPTDDEGMIVDKLQSNEVARAYLDRLESDKILEQHAALKEFADSSKPPKGWQFNVDEKAPQKLAELIDSPQGKAMVVHDISKARITPDPESVGKCFQKAAEFASQYGGTIVHGFVDGAEGKTYHAWVEVEHNGVKGIYEPTYKKFFSVSDFNKNLKPVEDARVTAQEAPAKISELGYGPYTEQGMSSILETKRGDPIRFKRDLRLKQIDIIRERVEKIAPQLPNDIDAKQIFLKALEVPDPINDVFGEQDYKNQPTLVGALREATPDKVAEKLDASIAQHKEEVTQNIKDASVYEMNKVADVMEGFHRERVRADEYDKLTKDPNLRIVDRFKNADTPADHDLNLHRTLISNKESELALARERLVKADTEQPHADALNALKDQPDSFVNRDNIQANVKQLEKELSDLKSTSVKKFTGIETHHKNGYSPFAIDPRSLTEEQRSRYLDNEQLKKHKAFVKGGTTPEKAAALLGVNGGENLLRILSQTPSREDIVAARMKEMDATIKQQALDSVNLNETALSKAYHKAAENYLAISKYLRTKDWSSYGKVIKKIATKLPRIDEITRQADETINQTRIGDLNPNQFKVGERRSHRLAMDEIIKGDIENASNHAEAAALNAELTRAAHVAIGESSRLQKFARRMERADRQQELRDAGYLDPYNELVNSFKLAPNKDDVKINSYQKFAAEMYESGNGDFEIPPHLSDVRQSFNDMTVEQMRAIDNTLRRLYHQAKMKNKLNNEFGDPAKQLQTREAIAAGIVTQLQKNPTYDPNRHIEKDWMTLTKAEVGAKICESMSDWVTNLDHLVTKAENGEIGLLSNITAMLKGDGKYKDQGMAQRGRDMISLGTTFKQIVEDFNRQGQEILQTAPDQQGRFIADFKNKEKRHGLSEWDFLHNEDVFVPEFEKSKRLGNGHVNKGMLFKMLLNFGNEGNKERLKNFGVDPDILQNVLERELDHHHALAAQRIWNIFKEMYPRVEKMHEEMTGIKPEMVQASPLEFKGKMYDGGYFPIQYAADATPMSVRKAFKDLMDVVSGEKQASIRESYHTDDMTRHGHTEKRTANDRFLDLNMGKIGLAFESVIHDLNFRKPIRDSLQILLHKDVSKELANVVGNTGFNRMVNTVFRTAGSIQMQNTNRFESNNMIQKVNARILSGASHAYLLFRMPVIKVQLASIPLAVNRMGTNGAKHFGDVLATMASNPRSMGEIYRLAGEINPAVERSHEGLNDHARDSVSKMLPQKNTFKTLAPINHMLQTVSEVGFGFLEKPDQIQKVAFAIAAYKQFIAGDAKGWNAERVNSLSPEERDSQAKIYASKISREALTTNDMIDRSRIQHDIPWLAQFFSDGRNVLNNAFYLARPIKHSLEETTLQTKKDGSGTYQVLKPASDRYYNAATATMKMAFVLGSIKLMSDVLKGRPNPLSSAMGMGYDAAVHGQIPSKSDLEDWALNMGRYLAWAPVDQVLDNTPVYRTVDYMIKTTDDKNEWTKQYADPLTQAGTDLYHTAMVGINFMDIITEQRELKSYEKKSLLMMGSYLTAGIPVNALLDAQKSLDDLNVGDMHIPPLISRFTDRLSKFKESQASLPKDEQAPPEVMKALEGVDAQLNAQHPDEASINIPSGTIDSIKEAESGGNQFAKNPNSSAAGLYQFTDKTWKYVMDNAPDLHLTEDGRVSSNTDQQERAMQWFTEHNARILKKSGVELTKENIYAAHFLGVDSAVDVLKSPGDMKLKLLISNEAMQSNDFKNSMKVKDFKNWLKDRLSSGDDEAVANK
jgi:hypothetical protein